MTEVLRNLSDDLAATVETAGSGLVRVEARRRLPASGIVWSSDGVVVTAHHVIERDENISVGTAGGDLVLTEIMINPKRASDRHGEWVEVLNSSERTVVLDHLVLEDGERHLILPEEALVLTPGARVLKGG